MTITGDKVLLPYVILNIIKITAIVGRVRMMTVMGLIKALHQLPSSPKAVKAAASKNEITNASNVRKRELPTAVTERRHYITVAHAVIGN